MRILNIMLSAGRGGIEQASLDYACALAEKNHDVVSLLVPNSWIAEAFRQKQLAYLEQGNWGRWDIRAGWQLRRTCRDFAADVIVAHADRALHFATSGTDRVAPVVTIVHNERARNLHRADAACATTRSLAEEVIGLGVPRECVFHVPNMIALPKISRRSKRHSPFCIGSMGRFVRNKGFDVYLHALRHLQDKGAVFHALLGGVGEEEHSLRELRDYLGLTRCVEFCGWIEDRAAFYRRLDLFCLPSRHEPFGIVVLEAWAHGAAVVAAATRGPGELVNSSHNGVIVPVEDAKALADAMAVLLEDSDKIASCVQNGYVTAARYTHSAVGVTLEKALRTTYDRFHDS